MQSLVYDCIVLMDIAHCEYFNEDYRKFLFTELSRALDLVDFDTLEGIAQAAAYIDSHIYANTDYRGPAMWRWWATATWTSTTTGGASTRCRRTPAPS